jgi:RimJ/RimL family protein N-acetyltransferase
MNVQDNLRDGIPYPYTEKDAIDYINLVHNALKDTQYVFAITADDVAIGSIGLHRREGQHRLTAELGYYVTEQHWGKGITTEAIKQICEFAFIHTDLVRIFAEPFSHNSASCRVLEKAGFQYEGLLRQNCIKKGKILDMRLYSRIKNNNE